MNDIAVIKVVHGTCVDGPGFRSTVYAAGCSHQCLGCHNPQSWRTDRSNTRSINDLSDELLADEFADITFSGGDPLFQVEAFAALAKQIKARSNKNIWCYTGFTYDQIVRSARLSVILPYVNVIVDGRFEQQLKCDDLPFRGSSNQRIIDIPQSLICHQVVLWRANLQVDF